MGVKRKMKKMGGPVFYRSYKPATKGKNAGKGGWDEEDFVGGVLVDVVTDKKYNRDNYHIKVEEMEFAEATVNQNDEKMKIGDIFVLNGCGILEKHFANLQRGQYCKVTFKGEAPIKSGEWKGEMAVVLEVEIEEDFQGFAQGVKDVQDKSKEDVGDNETTGDLL